MPRLFVAIDFPPELKRSLASLCAGVSGARCVAPDNFHLTLRFIGAVDEPTSAAIITALRGVKAPCFRMTLAGVGQFGGHTLWVGVEHNPDLLRLQSAVESELGTITPAADERPYQPHVKLAQSRRRRRFLPFLTEHAAFRAEPFEVRAFSLIESHLGKGGSVYERRAVYALSPGEGVTPPPTNGDRQVISDAPDAGLA